MKLIFKNWAVFLILTLVMVGESSFSDDEIPDIRYRSIIYFYPQTSEVSISRAAEQFERFRLVDELPESAMEPVVALSIIRDIKSSIPIPDLSYLSYFGNGLDKQQATRIQSSNLALVIDVAYPANMPFEGLKAVTESVFTFATSTDSLIWDSETRELFSPQAWKEKRVDSWDGHIPRVQDHTVIHAYNNKSLTRAISLGMAKFGLPDVVVNDFSWSLNNPMGNLINLVAQSLVEGLVPDEQGVLHLDISDLKNADFKNELVASLKDNAESKVSLPIGRGKWEEGDPENYIIELLFHNAQGASLSEKQEALLSGLFGWEDQISYVTHNQLIEAASERARNKLPGLKKSFNEGLNPGEFIQVKAPFRTPDGGKEWMWVEVLSWKGGVIKGLLKNQPYHIPDLKGGSEVTVSQDDIFDYIRIYPDGSSEGNETGELIRKYQN